VPLDFDDGAEPMVRQITVSPTTGLDDGDRVLVTGTGFHPFSWVDVDMCVAGATSWADCDHQNTSWNWAIGPARPIPANWGGLPEGFRGRMPVSDHLELDSGIVDCRAEPCFLVFNAFHDRNAYEDPGDPPFDPYVVVPLEFGPS
jgi:hypothetical protein